MHQASYRVRQFFSALFAPLLARVSENDLCQADEYLPPEAQKLFRQMSVADQRHSLVVMRTLRDAGHTHPALLVAALLHDVGKSAAWLTPVHRAIIVLSQRFWPAALDWLAREPAPGCRRFSAWRKPFIVHRCHPELGARWAEQAGCDEVSITLIRRHQEPIITWPRERDEIEHLLAKLQQADKEH